MRSFIIVHCSPGVLRVVKSMMVIWVGNVACMGEMRNFTKF